MVLVSISGGVVLDLGREVSDSAATLLEEAKARGDRHLLWYNVHTGIRRN